jgi:thioredoxin-like negative regulator of GroEL
MDRIAENSDSVHAIRINVQNNPRLAEHHSVKSIPTLDVYKDGVRRHRVLAFAKLQAVLERV